MKLADKKQIALEKTKVWAKILDLANTYTGAKFDRPLNLDQSHIIDACVDFIFNYYASISFEELEIAFQLALSGRLKEVDITTYYGKFTVQTISTVLKGYLEFRKSIQIEFQKLEDERKRAKTEKEVKERNEQAISDIKKAYQNLVDTYKLTGEFDKEEIKPFWGKILVEQGVINFTAEDKKQIYDEAKEIVTNELKAQLGSNDDMMLRKSLISLLNDIENGNSNEDFISKSKAKYGYLIVVKSILNSI